MNTAPVSTYLAQAGYRYAEVSYGLRHAHEKKAKTLDEALSWALAHILYENDTKPYPVEPGSIDWSQYN
jgi:hypothetical protein